MRLAITALAAAAVFVPTHGVGGAAAPAEDIRDLKLRDWQPRSMLAT